MIGQVGRAQAGIDSGSKVMHRIHTEDGSPPNGLAPCPHLPQDLPGNCGLDQHGDPAVPLPEPAHLLQDHPLGNVEIRLAGEGIKPPVTLKVALRRQVCTVQQTQLRIGDPGRVAQHKPISHSPAQDAWPVCPEEISLFHPRPTTTNSTRLCDVPRIDVNAEDVFGAWKRC